MLCLAPTAHAQKTDLTEYDLKAAFLYRFAKYIEWPAEAFEGTQTQFVLGILGEDPFGGAFDEAPTWKPINGRKFVVQRFKSVRDAHACHLLFISASERKRLAETLAALPQTPLLTVGDQERFAEQGGMLNLVLVEKKIRFEINIDAVEQARLKLDPQLLNSAVKIHRKGKGH